MNKLVIFFLCIGFMTTGCKEKVYLVKGDVDTGALDCAKYPEMDDFKKDLDEVIELAQIPSSDLDLSELKELGRQMSEKVESFKKYFKPELTTLDYPVTYQWVLSKRKLPKNAELKLLGFSFNGYELPLGSVVQTDGDQFIQFSVPQKIGILDICGLSKTMQALVEVSYGKDKKYYYRLMI